MQITFPIVVNKVMRVPSARVMDGKSSVRSGNQWVPNYMSKITMYTGFKMILMIWVTTNFLELKIV